MFIYLYYAVLELSSLQTLDVFNIWTFYSFAHLLFDSIEVQPWPQGELGCQEPVQRILSGLTFSLLCPRKLTCRLSNVRGATNSSQLREEFSILVFHADKHNGS